MLSGWCRRLFSHLQTACGAARHVLVETSMGESQWKVETWSGSWKSVYLHTSRKLSVFKPQTERCNGDCRPFHSPLFLPQENMTLHMAMIAVTTDCRVLAFRSCSGPGRCGRRTIVLHGCSSGELRACSSSSASVVMIAVPTRISNAPKFEPKMCWFILNHVALCFWLHHLPTNGELYH